MSTIGTCACLSAGSVGLKKLQLKKFFFVIYVDYLSSSVDPQPMMVGLILRLVRSNPLNRSGRQAFRIRLVKVTLLDNLIIAISFFKVLESYLQANLAKLQFLNTFCFVLLYYLPWMIEDIINCIIFMLSFGGCTNI